MDGEVRRVPVELSPWTLKREFHATLTSQNTILIFFNRLKGQPTLSKEARREHEGGPHPAAVRNPLLQKNIVRDEHGKPVSCDQWIILLKTQPGELIAPVPSSIPTLPGRPNSTPSQTVGNLETLGYLGWACF